MNNNADKIIQLENIVKSFDGEQVLKGINLSIGDKEFVTLLGPVGMRKDYYPKNYRRIRKSR